MIYPISGILEFAALLMFVIKKFAYLKKISPDKLIVMEISIYTFDALDPRYLSIRRAKPQAEMHCMTISKTYFGSPHA